jgi:UDP-N-acetyl-alpha-D-muramoyl-L-alanyl-L-glutamate epimerase
MPPADNNIKFKEFRERFTYFIYETYEYFVGDDSLDIKFTFNLGGKYVFTPLIRIPFRDFYNFKNIPSAALDNVIFHIGMVEMVSYWKAACPPLVIVKPFKLNEEQVKWWKNLYFSGLGEFFT